jgi:hypothetical protein
MNNEPRLFARTWRAGALLLALIILYFVAAKVIKYIPNLSEEAEIIKHLILTLIAVMGVHLLERAWLWRDIAEWNRSSLEGVLQSTDKLVESAAACGLEKVYSSRKEAKDEIIKAINGSKERIWLLGVCISQEIRLATLATKLTAKKSSKDNFQVRILLLDALRSTSVFRTFLESSAATVRKIIDTDRRSEKRLPPADPYFYQLLYTDFEHAFRTLKLIPELKESVRFYAHTPICWLAIIDDAAYFQPYTFGRTKSVENPKPTIGDMMPVFKFTEKTNTPAFEVLSDHFNKLWLTSDSDLFHIEARIADKGRIIRSIFKNRESWLRHVYGVLFQDGKPFGEERRRSVRKPCQSKPPIHLDASWMSGDSIRESKTHIVDFCREGMALQLEIESVPDVGSNVTVAINSELNSLASNHFKNELLSPTDGIFKVIYTRTDNGKPVVGLKMLGREDLAVE